MNVQALIDAIVTQTTVLLAQLATSGGLRAPLAHVANHFPGLGILPQGGSWSYPDSAGDGPIAVDATDIYYLAGNELRKMSQSGGSHVTVTTEPGFGTPVGVNATHVFWIRTITVGGQSVVELRAQVK